MEVRDEKSICYRTDVRSPDCSSCTGFGAREEFGRSLGGEGYAKELRDGEPVPTAAFEALMTFNQGGTTLMSVKGNTNLPNVVRTPFHGIWRKDHGWSEYTFKVMHIRSHVTTMEFLGLQETGGTITLGESGDDYTANTYTVVYSIDGVPGVGGCSTTVGTRIKFNE